MWPYLIFRPVSQIREELGRLPLSVRCEGMASSAPAASDCGRRPKPAPDAECRSCSIGMARPMLEALRRRAAND